MASRQEVIAGLMQSEEKFTTDIDRYKIILDGFAPVLRRIVVVRPPAESPAPDYIVKDWVGTEIPVRTDRESSPHGSNWVLAREAIYGLKAKGSEDAAQWWEDFYSVEAALDLSNIKADENPSYLANVDFLGFDDEWVEPASEGK